MKMVSSMLDFSLNWNNFPQIPINNISQTSVRKWPHFTKKASMIIGPLKNEARFKKNKTRAVLNKNNEVQPAK